MIQNMSRFPKRYFQVSTHPRLKQASSHNNRMDSDLSPSKDERNKKISKKAFPLNFPWHESFQNSKRREDKIFSFFRVYRNQIKIPLFSKYLQNLKFAAEQFFRVSWEF